MGKSNKSVSYIIAAYNEDSIIEESIEYCIKCLEQDFEEYEIILIDDGSNDDTGHKIDELASKYINVNVLHNLVNLNFGVSVQRGIIASKNDFIIYNAVDLPLDPNQTKKIIDMMEDIDVLVLQRMEYLGTTKWRKITSFFNRILMLILFPSAKKGIADTNFTQVFRRGIINHVLPMARGPIFTWPEMIFRARYKGLRVKTVDIEYNPRTVRKGAFGRPHDIIWGLYEMFRFRIHLYFRK